MTKLDHFIAALFCYGCIYLGILESQDGSFWGIWVILSFSFAACQCAFASVVDLHATIKSKAAFFLATCLCVVYGLTQHIVTFVCGDSVVAQSTQQFFGRLGPKGTATATLFLQNFSGRPISAFDAKASCLDVAIDDLPLVLGQKEFKSIRVRLLASSVDGMQRESMLLLLEDSASNFELSVTTLLHPNS